MRLVLLLSLVLSSAAVAAEGRATLDLSGPGWKLLRDPSASWRDDKLFAPPVDVKQVPATRPTMGWDGLYASKATNVSVPGTVEEFLWGDSGDPSGTNGNYQGVSFWWRTFDAPADWAGKTVLLRFAACRQRAEVYLNEQLVGYDVVGNTPFECDITKAVKLGAPNRLAVRITDHNDNTVRINFDWADYAAQPWGNTTQRIPGGHGFGGITGDVSIMAVDAVYIADVFVRNRPSPSTTRPTDADVEVELVNATGRPQNASLALRVYGRGKPDSAELEQTLSGLSIPPGRSMLRAAISVPQASLWDIDQPNLYQCAATLRAGDATDTHAVTFGFRWFAPEDLDKPDPVLRLNGRRVMVRSAISWGYWPASGLCTTPELAQRQVRIARELGLNALSMHRTIADPLALQAADEAGLLIYAEPGGYKCDEGDAIARALATEKLMRMIRRDRNHPSIFAWGMINEIWVRQHKVFPEYLRDIMDAHALDPSRLIALASGQATLIKNLAAATQPVANPSCSWVPPYGGQRFEIGWMNEHRAGGPGVYHDALYVSPTQMYGGEGPPGTIIYWGEEGAIPAPPQLDDLVADYRASGRLGWDGHDYLAWHKGYSDWLDAHDGRKSFATVNDLCRSLGNVAFYYHGRIIENTRITNKIDGYVVNGWECMKLDNHSGIVDVARRPKGDVSLLAHYNRPVHLAVKPRKKVVEAGATVACDLHIVNEKNLRGPHTLRVRASRPLGGAVLMEQDFPVDLIGGETFGQLLQENVQIPVGDAHGYVKVVAMLLAGDRVVADGHDEIYVIDVKAARPPDGGAVVDSTGAVGRFLGGIGCQTVALTPDTGFVPYIVLADTPIKYKDHGGLLQRVTEQGTTLIVIANADLWAQALKDRGLIQYDGSLVLGRNWIGGSFFVLKHELFTGLPQGQAMNWEYQAIQKQNQPKPGRYGLLLRGDEAAAGCFNSHDPRLATAVGIIKVGKGRVILSTLPMMPYLESSDPAAAMPRRLLANYLAFGVVGDEPATQPAITMP